MALRLDLSEILLVVDDTWAGGGHAQSVALAVSQVGAGRVSILTVARWLDPDDDVTKQVIRERIKDRRYDPAICPWTGGICPT